MNMSEELEELLKENIEISRESLKILKGIRRANRLASAFKIFYWLIIIGSAVGAYYFLEPYIKQGLAIVNQFQEAISAGGTQKTSSDVKNVSQNPSDILKNLSPDLLKKLQDALNIK